LTDFSNSLPTTLTDFSINHRVADFYDNYPPRRDDTVIINDIHTENHLRTMAELQFHHSENLFQRSLFQERERFQAGKLERERQFYDRKLFERDSQISFMTYKLAHSQQLLMMMMGRQQIQQTEEGLLPLSSSTKTSKNNNKKNNNNNK
jgi:hypothetical protein